MMVIATGFIPISPLFTVSAMVMLESSHWFGMNNVRSTGKQNSRKAWIGALTGHGDITKITLKIQSIPYNQSKP